MTQDTEQERAEFEDGAWYWVEFQGFGSRKHVAPAMYKADSDAWYSYEWSGHTTRFVKVLEPCLMQATRRAPVVPSDLREAAQDALDWLEDDDANMTHNIRERLRAALAAAPQPPEAETDSLGIPKSCRKPLCSPRKHHPLCDLADHTEQLLEMVAQPDAITALKRCARVLSGEDMTKSALIRALEGARAVLKAAESQKPWKDHQTAQLVSQLTDIAREYGHTQQLRERIAGVIRPLAQHLKGCADE